MMPAHKTGALVMAAGASSRLGRPKQLLSFNGQSLVKGVAEQIVKLSLNPIVVVTGAASAEVKAELPAAVGSVDNLNWHQGLGSSIAAGLSELIRLQPKMVAVLIVLADQPLVTQSHLSSLIEFLSLQDVPSDVTGQSSLTRPIVATAYKSGPGVPAVFPAESFNLLAGLRGDHGARSILRSQQYPVHTIVPDFDLLDIDTEQDYQQLTQQHYRNAKA